MTFKAYDILSSLVPGFLVLLVLQHALGIAFNKDMVVVYTAIGFLIGYIINALSSWLEDLYFFTWGGKPSDMLLKGKDTWKVKCYNATAAKTALLDETANKSADNDELFSIAMRYANTAKDTRIDDFNGMYAFSRALLTTMLIATPITLYMHHNDWRYYALLLPSLLIIWLRCKQRGYYYANEVLQVYIKAKDIQPAK